MRSLLGPAIVSSALVLACATGPTDRSPTLTVVPSAAPASCGVNEVLLILNTFVEAFNRGDDPARFFSTSGGNATGFQWYSASGRGRAHVVIDQRNDLAAYFASRHLAGERWSQLTLQYSGDRQAYPRADFGFLITRSGPDLAELTTAESTLGQTQGKGALNCRDRLILLFTM